MNCDHDAPSLGRGQRVEAGHPRGREHVVALRRRELLAVERDAQLVLADGARRHGAAEHAAGEVRGVSGGGSEGGMAEASSCESGVMGAAAAGADSASPPTLAPEADGSCG